MKISNIYKVLILFLFVYSTSNAQKQTFEGQILVFDSIPVMNAEILINSTKQIVKSDSAGNFKFEGKINEKIKISANGFTTKSQKLTGDSNFYKENLKLKKSYQLAIDSGHIEDLDLFFRLMKSKKNNPDYSRYMSAVDIIKDKYSNVSIGGNGVVIRGVQSINGPNEALIEIDGVILDFDALENVPTSGIISVNILSPAMSGMYGSRGANGVVVIKTKKGDRK